MKEKIITTIEHKEIKFDGKLIFNANLGCVKIKGCVEADLIVIKPGTYIQSDGYIRSGGDIWSDGYIWFNYYISFKTKITCKLLRISTYDNFERSFWIEKYILFGFKKMAEMIKSDCAIELLPKHQSLSPKFKKKLLACKYWTNTERMVIKSWLDGGLKDYEIK